MRVHAKKRFGQHFLQDAWAEKLIAVIEPQSGEQFIEIGPGSGVLTFRLASRVSHLTAIEIDRDMIATLEPRLPANVTLIHVDFLDANLTKLAGGHRFRVAGNLPYNVSTPLLFHLLQNASAIEDMHFMLQREVVQRIVA